MLRGSGHERCLFGSDYVHVHDGLSRGMFTHARLTLKKYPEWLMVAIVVAIMSAWATCSYRYGQVWIDELALWQHATRLAPVKPRPRIHLALALLERSRFAEAAQVMDETDAILAQPNYRRPAYDHKDAVMAQSHNRELLWATHRVMKVTP